MPQHSQTVSETPPRTWRRLEYGAATIYLFGNTSTDVEKTSASGRLCSPSRKHLHGRGEDGIGDKILRRGLETPPRTWRRQRRELQPRSSRGNTSTDVEKTGTRTWIRLRRKKHLHGRGEDPYSPQAKYRIPETPPRTWRRQYAIWWRHFWEGNTSTDVEKTQNILHEEIYLWKHLHGRGEDEASSSEKPKNWETPPRTWRRLFIAIVIIEIGRNTSTDVEKTSFPSQFLTTSEKHLHGRGEDFLFTQFR